MYNDIKILIAKLTEVIAVFDWKINWQKKTSLFDINDLLICLINQFQLENSNDLNYFTYLTNFFDLLKPKTYEKAMALNLTKKQTNVIK